MQIRCRPNKEGSNAGIHNTLCEKFQSGVKCSDSPVCPFPHNHLEMQLWELESSGAFNIQSFIKETGEKGICKFKENLYILIEQVYCCNISSVPWWNLANSKIKIVQEREKTVFLSYLWMSDQSFFVISLRLVQPIWHQFYFLCCISHCCVIWLSEVITLNIAPLNLDNSIARL